MRMMVLATLSVVLWSSHGPVQHQTAYATQTASAPKPKPDELDKILAPIALYPDQLLSQILLCAQDPDQVVKLKSWLAQNAALKGTELQDAATAADFGPSFVALSLFPPVIDMLAADRAWTTRLGQAFTADAKAVFASIQRLRAQAEKAGSLKDTPQQNVETKKTESGTQVIVIEPTNPQVVYVPQYNPQVVYVEQESNNAGAAAAGAIIGFTAGIAIGAAMDNDYYYGPYGMRGGFYMYDDAWDDWYDHREDAREDWIDHRDDVMEERGDRVDTRQEQRSDRTDSRQDTRSTTQSQRTERTQTRQESRPQTATQSAAPRTSSAAARGYSGEQAKAARSGAKSDAFSGYSSGKSAQASSSRGQRSRSSGGGGARSGGGGGRRK